MAGRLLASAADDDDNVWLGWFEAVVGPAIRQWCQWWRIDLIRLGGALIGIFDFCSRDRFYHNGAEKRGECIDGLGPTMLILGWRLNIFVWWNVYF